MRLQPMTLPVRALACLLMLLWTSASPLAADAPPDTSTCRIEHATLALEDGPLRYNRIGQGTPVLLLHGLFARKEQWNRVACALAEAGFTAIAPDLPGYGASRHFPLADYTLDRQALLLHELVQSLGVGRIDLAGNSMGGAIAVFYARRHAGEVDRVAFVGPPLGWTDWGPKLRAALDDGTNPFIPTDASQLDLEMSLLFHRPPRLAEAQSSELLRRYRIHDFHYQQVWNVVSQFTGALAEIRGDLLGAPHPTLILWGEDDRIYPVSAAASLQQRIPGSQLVRLPDTGHLPMLEQSQETARQLIEFFRTPAPESAPH